MFSPTASRSSTSAGKQPVRPSAADSASPSSTRAIAAWKAARCTVLPICFSVIRSASAAVMPFSSSTESVCAKASTVCATTNGPVSGSRSSHASVAARPASVRRQPRKELKPAMAATISPMPHGLSRNSESPISSEVEAGILPPRDVRSVFRRGSRKTRKNTITPPATTTMKAG
ncbi:MAG: hypothetical protein RL479_1739 [Verrucomicrobiota bacterium]